MVSEARKIFNDIDFNLVLSNISIFERGQKFVYLYDNQGNK